MQQRGYREKYSGTVKELEDVLPDEYKTNDPRLARKKVARGKHTFQALALS